MAEAQSEIDLSNGGKVRTNESASEVEAAIAAAQNGFLRIAVKDGEELINISHIVRVRPAR